MVLPQFSAESALGRVGASAYEAGRGSSFAEKHSPSNGLVQPAGPAAYRDCMVTCFLFPLWPGHWLCPILCHGELSRPGP